MGDRNSSVTRVWPVFEYLFQRDDTGSQWLSQLLSMGSLANLAGVRGKMGLGRYCHELPHVIDEFRGCFGPFWGTRDRTRWAI
jgi:hypothetical protein